MFEAINQYVILQKVEAKTDSGIVIAEGDSTKIKSYKVVSTTEETKELQDRTIMAHVGMVSDLGQGYYAVLVEEIRAVKTDA